MQPLTKTQQRELIMHMRRALSRAQRMLDHGNQDQADAEINFVRDTADIFRHQPKKPIKPTPRVVRYRQHYGLAGTP